MCASTPIDVYKSLSFSQHVATVVQQLAEPSSLLVQMVLENTFIMGLISTPLHPLLLKTHDFIKKNEHLYDFFDDSIVISNC